MQVIVLPTSDGYDVCLTRQETVRTHTDGSAVRCYDQIVYHVKNQFELRENIVYLQRAYPQYFEHQKIMPNRRLAVIGESVIDTDEHGNITNQWFPGCI